MEFSAKLQNHIFTWNFFCCFSCL